MVDDFHLGCRRQPVKISVVFADIEFSLQRGVRSKSRADHFIMPGQLFGLIDNFGKQKNVILFPRFW